MSEVAFVLHLVLGRSRGAGWKVLAQLLCEAKTNGMKTVIKVVPIKGSCSSGHDIAGIHERFTREGWRVIKVFEERGRCYVMVEQSK